MKLEISGTELITFAGLAILAATLFLLRRRHIRAEYSFGWLTVGFILCVGALLGKRLSGWLGIALDTFCLGLAAILLTAIVFEISAAVSRLRDENVILAQRLAILEHGFPRKEITTRPDDNPKP